MERCLKILFLPNYIIFLKLRYLFETLIQIFKLITLIENWKEKSTNQNFFTINLHAYFKTIFICQYRHRDNVLE